MSARRRSLLPWALRVLPRPVRHAVLRRKALVDQSLLDDVVVEVAHTREAYQAAFQLVHDAYVKRGWLKPAAIGQFLTKYHALPDTTVFVLRRGTHWLGTVSLVLDSPVGLPIDHTFGDELGALRRPGRRVAEVCSLAVAPEARRTGLTFCLMVAMWRYARHVAKVSDLVIAVDAHVGEYYEALFGFSAMGPARNYEGFRETARALEEDPVVALHQDLAAAEADCDVRALSPEQPKVRVTDLALSPFPAAWEKLAPEVLEATDALAAARYRLPRDVFQEFFGGPDAPEALDAPTLAQVLTVRTLSTVSVPPRHNPALRLAFTG